MSWHRIMMSTSTAESTGCQEIRLDMLASLQAFITVAEEGGFASAGRKLSLATSSVTRQVDALEKMLGTQLLTRSTRNVDLTAAGHIYFEHAIRIINDLEFANQEARDESGEPRGILRASLPVSFSRLHIAPLLTPFSQLYPLISLDLIFSDEIVDLVDKRLDLSVRLGRVESPNLIARKLLSQRRCVCASPDYLKRHGIPQVPEDLKEHNCMVFSYTSGKSKWYFTNNGQVIIDVKGSLKCNNSEILLEAALSGFGIALLPDWLVCRDIAEGRLIHLLSSWRPEVNEGEDDSAIYAIYHPTRRNTKKVKVFVEFLYEQLSRSLK